MNKLTQIVFGICGALVFIGAVQIISPGKAMKKSVAYVLGVVFVISLLVPLFALKDVSLDFDMIEQTHDSSNALSHYAADYMVRAVLDGAGIKYDNLMVNADISEDNRITIISVTLVSDFPREQVVQALGELVAPDGVEVLNE